MNYKIYQNINNENKYFIYQYDEIGYNEDFVHGIELSKNKETNEWRLIYYTAMDKNYFNKYYHNTSKSINLDKIIITHLLGVLDII